MKKIYAVLAAALGLSMTATAAPQLNKVISQDAILSQLNTEVAVKANVNKVKPAKQNAPKKVSSVADIEGVYLWDYYGLLEGKSGPATGSVNIVATGNGNEFAILGMPYSDVEIIGNLDPVAGTVTVLSQDLYFNTNYNEMVRLVFEEFIVDDQGYIKATEVTKDKITGVIGADGTITWDDTLAFAVRITPGYFSLAWRDVFGAVPYWSFDASEWDLMGQGSYYDVYVNTFIGTIDASYIVPAQAVNIYKHKTDPRYCVENPYGAAVWSQTINEGNGKGYIVVNCEEPECVLVEPFVKTGMIMDLGDENNPDLEEILALNEEGARYYFDNYYIDEIMEEYGAIGLPMSNLTDNVITLENPKFGTDQGPADLYWWTAGKDAEGKPIWADYEPGKITLPGTGVEGVMDDNMNAPVKYFNLQGVEVANPAKGEIVIMKQGSKATKTVIR